MCSTYFVLLFLTLYDQFYVRFIVTFVAKMWNLFRIEFFIVKSKRNPSTIG